MSEPNSTQSQKPVTLEALLRLKRAERPPAEFWNGFEDRLRQRMLREMVAEKAVPVSQGWAKWSRRLWLATPAAVAAVLLWWTPGPSLVPASTSGDALEPSLVSLQVPKAQSNPVVDAATPAVEAQFVSDLLSTSLSRPSSSFTRVLASEMLAASPMAAVYVANPLTRTTEPAIGDWTTGFDRF